jgi:hypothetical protein
MDNAQTTAYHNLMVPFAAEGSGPLCVLDAGP